MNSHAVEQGKLWGTSSQDWAEIQQPTIRPVSHAILDELAPWHGKSLLDIGCGAGDFLRLAHQHGATTYGLDPSGPLIQIARQHAPDTEFQIGDAERLPYPNEHFHVTAAVNSLHFTTNPHHAMEEMIRVTQPSGTLITATWGPPRECDAVTLLLDLGALLPPVPPLQPQDLDLTDINTHAHLLTHFGLTPTPPRIVNTPWHYPNLNSALRGLLSIGPAAAAIRYSGRDTVTRTITESLAPYRQPDDSYLLHNTCHYLTATRRGSV